MSLEYILLHFMFVFFMQKTAYDMRISDWSSDVCSSDLPELLVLDEPFSGLDPVNQEKLEKLILAERDRGVTILFSTHVMAHAERLCDRLAIIARGKRRFEGTVADARGTLPLQIRYVPHHPGEGLRALLPADAASDGAGWRFTITGGGIDTLRSRLIDAGCRKCVG